jgi:MFS family permease
VNDDDRAVVGLVTLAHALVHTYELSIPVLVPVWLAEFGVSKTTLGAVATAGYALFGLGALPGGVLADRVGAPRLIAGCLVGMAGSFLVLSVAPSPAVIAVAVLLWGGAASVYHPAGLTLISRGVSDRGTAFAYHGIAGNLGVAAGPLVTALVLSVADWRVAAGVLAVPALVGVPLALTADVETPATGPTAPDGGPGAGEDGSGDRETGEDPPDGAGDGPAGDDADAPAGGGQSLGGLLDGSRALFATAFLLVFPVVVASGLYYRGVLTFLPVVLADAPGLAARTVAGVAVEPSRFAYVGLLATGMAGQFAGGKLTDRTFPPRALVPLVAVGPVGVAVAGATTGFALFFLQPLYQATVAELTPESVRGLSYGYTYLGVFGVGALGGVLAGAALDFASVRVLFAGLAVVALGGALAAALLTRRRG